MLLIDADPEPQLSAFARRWFATLARGDWEAGLAMLDEPNAYGLRWTKASILAILHETFGPGTGFASEFGPPTLSDPEQTLGDACCSFGELDAGGFWLDHAVPLNGHYSDLVAQFEFSPRADGHAVVLHDLHVL